MPQVDLPRRTRIVATLGPATSSPRMIKRIIKAGVDIVRLNFSHGNYEFHAGLIETVQRVSAELGEHVAVMQDLSGPKMRVGAVADDAIRLRRGRDVEVIEGRGEGTEERLFVEAAGAIANLEEGTLVRLADGLLELCVTKRTRDGVSCRVETGGVLRSRQGVNIPGADLGVKALTPKDKRDLAFGVELGVDAVALSFVQDASDVMAVRKLLVKHGQEPFVVAKIERSQALTNLHEILEVTSGVMVARGDLGVEIGVEKVPMAQKRIIQEALARRRPVITATQMLESMIERPSATRAEVSDVANAVIEGTDALMLSGETAVGKHAVAAVRTLDSVAREAERALLDVPSHSGIFAADDPAQAVTRAARVAARACEARGILGFSNSGRTLRLISTMRPRRSIWGCTTTTRTARRMKFFWGVQPLVIGVSDTVDEMINEAEGLLVKRRKVRKGDRLVIVCGQAVTTGATNSIHIHTVGERRDGKLAGKAKAARRKARS